jgi:hypothetical protein
MPVSPTPAIDGRETLTNRFSGNSMGAYRILGPGVLSVGAGMRFGRSRFVAIDGRETLRPKAGVCPTYTTSLKPGVGENSTS